MAKTIKKKAAAKTKVKPEKQMKMPKSKVMANVEKMLFHTYKMQFDKDVSVAPTLFYGEQPIKMKDGKNDLEKFCKEAAANIWRMIK